MVHTVVLAKAIFVLHNAFFISGLEQEAEQETSTLPCQLATPPNKASYIFRHLQAPVRLFNRCSLGSYIKLYS